MDDIQPHNLTPEVAPDAIETERRLRRITLVLVILGVAVAGMFAGWKMVLGVALGGALSLFNERWLNSSTKAILEIASSTGNPSLPRASKFIFRFAVIVLVIAVAMKTGYFHLLGIALGFTAFVGAAMAEAIYQLKNFKD